MPTPIDPASRVRVWSAVQSLPFRTTHVPTAGTALRSVEDLVAFLEDYTRHATAEVDKIRGDLARARRSEVALRGLRADLDRTRSALEEIDRKAGE